MAHALLAAQMILSAIASAAPPAQTAQPDAGQATAPAATVVPAAATTPTASTSPGWQEEWVEQKHKLELFVPNGYLRIRPELFNKFDLGRAPDDSGFARWPRTGRERTQAGVNMRLRLDPTLNISEEVRIKMQVDALDNLVMGSTPDYAHSRSAVTYPYDRNEFALLSESQVPPRSGINSLQDSIAVKRAYGEVSTPVGILRFGRMGSHWGLGMVHNDGNCLDCDFGDTVDRVMFVTEPIAGYYLTPMFDYNATGIVSNPYSGGGQSYDLSNTDNSNTLSLVAARRDTDEQARAKLDNGQAVFNYGIYFSYRNQTNDAADLFAAPYAGDGTANGQAKYVPRKGELYMPDLWVKYERKAFRLELEAAAVLGKIGNRAQSAASRDDVFSNQALSLAQFGAAGQGEYRFLDGALRAQVEVGFASGDKAPGFGNYPRRAKLKADGTPDTNYTGPVAGDFDGRQYNCGTASASGGLCADSTLNNFRFNRDYRVDMILWREIIGGVTDAIYAKPTVSYRVAEGLDIHASAIYSRAVFVQSTPSWNGVKGDENLGLELDLGARYETDDGFFAAVSWGILFPFGGLSDNRAGFSGSLDNAQALRGSAGIHF